MPFVLNTRALQILQKTRTRFYFKATHTKKNEPRIVRETPTRLASFSLSLFSFLYLRKKREIAREFSLSLFLPFFRGGKLFFSARGNLNAKRTHTDRLFFSLSTSLNETAITCSSSWCVLLLLFVFLIVGFYLLLRAFSLLCVASKTRSASGVSPGWCKRALGDLLFSLFLSLSLNDCALIGVVSLSSTHTHS